MNKSVKAALLSGLVFPGVGHLYLRRWLFGIVLAGIAGYALYHIVDDVLGVALHVSRQIESGAIPADVNTLTEVVARQLSESARATAMASYALLACWVIGIISAFMQGRALDRLDAQVAGSNPDQRNLTP
jgi:TM2 domain-containing membrane protein YozV